MLNNRFKKYDDIFFAFIHKDHVYPAIIKSKGYKFTTALKVLIKCFFNNLRSSFKKNSKSLDGKIWLFAESLNQYRALQDLTKFPQSVLVSKENSSFVEKEYQLHLNAQFKYRLVGLFKFWRYKKIFGKKFKLHLNTILVHDGIYESLLELLKKHRPLMIVFSNDHNAYCRALRLAATDLRIKTVYLQHAAVTEEFPPLNFSLSLLEGKDSLDKYQKAGTQNAKTALVGMPKFDKFHGFINQNKKLQAIGLALNAGDDFKLYFSLFENLYRSFSKLKFHIRFHPSINVSQIEVPSFFEHSSSSLETSFDFLNKIDMLVAGNSSIHLEAVMMNVVSAQINFTQKNIENDYYGFVKNKLTTVINEADLKDYINKMMVEKPTIRQRAKYYVDTVNTKHDGKSLNLVFEKLNEELLMINC